MIRLRSILAVTAVAMALVLSPNVASAQDYPPQPPPGSQVGCSVSVVFSGPVGPGATVSITVSCGSITVGRSYTGLLASTPVVLPTTVATADDQVTFANVRLPNDFEVPGFHTLTVVDAQTGAALGSARFFVDGGGRIAAAPRGTNIPRTGSDLTGPGLGIGAGLLAAGAGALVVARRRRSVALAA